MTLEDYGPEDADRKLSDAISGTNIVLMCATWVVAPEYRKYLSDPIKDRARKLFIVPCESLLHALQHKQEHEAVSERVQDRAEGTPDTPEISGGNRSQ
jgi:uncharacterized protein (DUF488 family)